MGPADHCMTEERGQRKCRLPSPPSFILVYDPPPIDLRQGGRQRRAPHLPAAWSTKGDDMAFPLLHAKEGLTLMLLGAKMASLGWHVPQMTALHSCTMLPLVCYSLSKGLRGRKKYLLLLLSFPWHPTNRELAHAHS